MSIMWSSRTAVGVESGPQAASPLMTRRERRTCLLALLTILGVWATGAASRAETPPPEAASRPSLHATQVTVVVHNYTQFKVKVKLSSMTRGVPRYVSLDLEPGATGSKWVRAPLDPKSVTATATVNGQSVTSPVPVRNGNFANVAVWYKSKQPKFSY